MKNSAKLIRVSVVGAGYMAEQYIKVLSDMSNVVISGIFSKTLTRSRDLGNKYNISCDFSSITDLYNKTKSDLVIVAVSELAAVEVCEEVFRFPWISLIEKPVGHNFETALRINQLAIDNKSKVFIALNRRHYSSVKLVVDDLHNFSGPRFVHIQDQEDQITALKAGQPREVVDFWMYANSIHLIDLFYVFCRGEITEIKEVIPWSKKTNYALHELIFDSGDIGIYQAIWNQPGPWSICINAENRRWELKPIERACYQDYGNRELIPFDISQDDLNYKPGLVKMINSVLDYMQGTASDVVSLGEGLRAMKLIKDIYKLER